MSNVADDEPAPYVIALSEDGRTALVVNMAAPGGWASYFSDDTTGAGLHVLLRVGPRTGPPATPFAGEDGLTGVRWDPADLAGEVLEVREMHVFGGQNAPRFNGQALRDVQFGRIEAAINHPRHRAALNSYVLPPNTAKAGDPAGVRFMIRPEPVKPERPTLKIEDPGGYRKPDSFYEQVALAFLWLAAVSNAPAQEFAEVNGVPVGTVHRWVREAKQRGLLRLPADRKERRG